METQTTQTSTTTNPTHYTLNDKTQMPISGIGTWNRKDPKFFLEAIRNGIRLFDTAQFYFTEVALGEGIQLAIKEGIIKREDIFIITKICIFMKKGIHK